MTSADIPDDEIIAEVQRRLSAGRFGDQGLYSYSQLDFRGCWCALSTQVADLLNEDFHQVMPVTAVRKMMTDLVDARPPGPLVLAINTTMVGQG